ncbi:MAG TPA: GNAT family N-acetyltransferase [Roseiflexaceae bacterium]|nr:GNAT family N-acetyltransferase [Roseiflexaceae bacterium]
MEIKQLSSAQARPLLDELAELLRDAVDGGASVGFLPPLAQGEAQDYWQQVLGDLDRGTRILLVATVDGRLVGTVQLDLPSKPNARHRAEIQKLLVHSSARRRGLGRALLGAAEEAARAAGRTLLVLDTRAGDAAEQLYRHHGYTAAGTIPAYARNGEGTLDATVVFFRLLDA